MSGQQQPGPVAARSNTNNGVPLPPTPEKLQQSLDHGIWYCLSLWPALHVATANNWGGPASSDKKDWFAGAVSDFLAANATASDADLLEDVEVFLLQVMEDEFDCRVEDESEVDVARGIVRLKKGLVEEKDLAVFREMERRWQNRGQMKVNVHVTENVDREVDDEDEEWDGFDEDGDGADVEMEEAPALVSTPRAKEKVQPEVDDDGFTRVVSKKKR